MIKAIEPYEYKDFLIRNTDYGKSLILQSNRIEESRLFIINENIQALEINYSLGYESMDLECLYYFRSIKSIRIVNRTININGLYYLDNLENLELAEESKQGIDFTKFKLLKNCYFCWREKGRSIFKCNNLEKLGIEKYNYDNLKNLSGLRKLKFLGIGNSNINSLYGIESLNELKEINLSFLKLLKELDHIKKLDLHTLVLSYLPQLASLNNIASIESLRIIDIKKCELISDISFLSKLLNLKYISLEDVGELDSIRPLFNLKELEEFYFTGTTNIVDGDLSPLLALRKLKRLSFRNRKHYSHSREDFTAYKK